MAKDEAMGKTTPYATCPICQKPMLTEDFDNHMAHSHTQEQRDRLKQEQGPQGHFYGDVWSKYEATVTQPYQLTQEEFDQITSHAWEGETCQECQSILQGTEVSDKGEYAIYPSPSQAEHMSDLFGYQAEPSMPTTGYLDPEDPQWQKSVEHIQERQKTPKGVGTFGPQSGMMRGEPTRDEWQVTSYLDDVGVTYIHKMKLGELDPTVEKPKVEYDIYIPDYLMAIETSPGWHEGGPSEGSFPQVIENDRFKRQFAKENGIDLMSFDPAQGTEKFINETLVPKLRAVGVDAHEVATDKKKEEFEKGNPFNQQYIYREEEVSWLAPTFKYGLTKDEEQSGRFPDPKNHIMGPGVEVKKCPHGNGVFTTRDFKEGEMISSFQSPFVPELTDPTRGWATLRVGDLWWEEPASGEEDEWANFLDHSKTPNSVFTNFNFDAGTGDLITTRPIKAGEEIYIDYGAYSPENISDVIEDLPSEDVPTVPETSTLEPTEPEKGLGTETAGYDWDVNVKYREKPILEEQSGINQNIPTGKYTTIEPLALDQSQNVPRYPERGKVNTITQEGGETEGYAADSHLFQEEVHAHTCPECGTEMYPVDMAHTLYRCPNWKGRCPNADTGVDAIACPKCLNKFLKSEGRWDKPPASDPEGAPISDNEAIQNSAKLADETGDMLLTLVQDGTITPEQGDVLIEYQTKAKEMITTGHFVEGRELLAKMLDYLISVVPSLNEPAVP